MTVTTAQVTTLLENVLFESATAAAANAPTWVGIANVNPAYSTVAGLSAYLATQPEAGIAEQVIRYYEGALGRVPSPSEISFYVKYIDAQPGVNTTLGVTGVPTSLWGTIAGFFTNSTEFKTDFGLTNGLTASDEGLVITGFYTNVLGRAPSSSEIQFYENAIASGVATPTTLLEFFTNSTEFQTKVDSSIQSDLASAGVAAVASVAAGGTPLTSTTPIGTTTTITTTTTTPLSTGIDNLSLSGNNNIVNGTANGATATYTVGDQIIGASGSTGNVLNLSDLTATGATAWNPGNLAGVTVSNFQTVNLTSAEQVTFNASTASAGFTGLTSLTVVSVSGENAAGNVDSIAAGSGVAIKVNDTQSVATTGALTVTGGSTVSIVENNYNSVSNGGTIVVDGVAGTTSVSVTQTEGATAGADQAVTITDKNEGAGTKAGTITSVTLDGLDGTNGHVSNVGINDSSLANLTVNDVAVDGTTVTVTEGAYASPATSLSLALNNDASFTLDDAGGAYKTISITTGATASAAIIDAADVTTLNVAGSSIVSLSGSGLAAVTTITISGAAGLVDTDYAASATLTTVTDTSSGGVELSLDDQATTFSGSTATGQEIITITQDATKAITGGKATNNEIIFNAAAATFTTADTGANVTGFTVLGTGADSSGTFSLTSAPFSEFKAIDVSDGVGVTVVFTGVTSGTAISIDAGATSVTDTQNDSTGSSDTVALTLGTSSGGATTTTTFIANDKAGAAVGALTINSEGTGANIISNLDTGVTGGISSLTISGNDGVTVSAWTDASSTLTITDNNTGSQASSFTLTDSSLTTLTIAGTNTAATTLNVTDNVLGSVTFTDSAAGAVSLTFASLTNATSLVVNDSSAKALSIADVADNNLTTLTLNNTGAGTLTDGTADGVQGSALATVNFEGTGKIASFLENTYTGTLTLNNTDTAAVTLTLTDVTSGNLLVQDSGANFTVAAGSTTDGATLDLNNTGTGTLKFTGVTDDHATAVNLTGLVNLTLTDTDAATVSILGASDNANNTIALSHTNATGAAKSDVITLGNGNNTITVTDTVELANTETITVGTGANTITLSVAHGNSVITIGENASSTTSLTNISGTLTGDELVFGGTAINSVVYSEGGVASVAAGVAGIVAADGYASFTYGGNTYYYQNTGSAATSTLVELIGTGSHTTLASQTTAHLFFA